MEERHHSPGGVRFRVVTAHEKLGEGFLVFDVQPYPYPHQVSKVRSLWSIDSTLVREFGKIDT